MQRISRIIFLNSSFDCLLTRFCSCHSLDIFRSSGLINTSCRLRERANNCDILLSFIKQKLLPDFHPHYIIQKHIQQQKMIKQKNEHIESQAKKMIVSGPALDFSFKNIRSLQQILAINSNVANSPKIEEIPKTETPGPHASEKQIGEGTIETRLNIVRTIEVQQSKGNLVKQLANKQIKKSSSKVVHKTQILTTNLFLSYNKLTNIEGWSQILTQILPTPKWEQLMWVDLSHNRLSEINKELQLLPQLKTLYLHVNFISSFKQFQNLQGSKVLRTFTIHGNPIQNYPQFRSLLTCILPQLQKIDSVLLTKREKERGQILKKQAAKYPVITNPQKPPADSSQEDEA